MGFFFTPEIRTLKANRGQELAGSPRSKGWRIPDQICLPSFQRERFHVPIPGREEGRQGLAAVMGRFF